MFIKNKKTKATEYLQHFTRKINTIIHLYRVLKKYWYTEYRVTLL